MVIEYYIYSDHVGKKNLFNRLSKTATSIFDIRKEIPESLLQKLTCPPNIKNFVSLFIETEKLDLINHVENMLSQKKVDYDKSLKIEITEDEIDKYDYYYIDLINLEFKKQIDYEFKHPVCDSYETCPWGAEIISPLKIKSKYTRNLTFGKIIDIWYLGQRFVISQKLMDIFKSEEITGLKYEPCIVDYNNGDKQENGEQFYVAEIVPEIMEFGNDIYINKNYFCKKHSMLFRYDGISDRILKSSSVVDKDFQLIKGIIIKGEKYFYRIPLWLISKRVLKILLEHAKTNLRPFSTFLNQPFVPVPFCENQDKCN